MDEDYNPLTTDRALFVLSVVPGVGDVIDVYDIGRAIVNGNVSEAAITAALMAAPGSARLLREGGAAVLRGVDDDIARQIVNIAQGMCSFSAETMVTTAEGAESIDEVEEGEYVLAYNELTGETGYYPVVAVWVHVDPLIVELTIDGEMLETTPEHPFYTAAGNWLPAAHLQIGDEIRTAAWETGTVEAIRFAVALQPMYNFTVATAHTYFVGSGQWLVHNACADDIFWGSQRKVNQAAERGWLIDDVQDVMRNPALTRTDPSMINRATGNSVTYYYRADGYYAVIDDITGEIVQVSDLFDPGWIDEMTNLPVQPITGPQK